VAFSDDQFAQVRPFLFHLTHQVNIHGIQKSRTLRSAAYLMKKAGEQSFLRRKRTTAVQVQIGTVTVSIRDQHPLYLRNMRLENGWSFEDVVQSLNERVFFWPGNKNGPISYGQRHFERHATERPVILRVSTADLYRENRNACPLYCRYNSGSPRCSNGVGSPRGPSTFVSSADADYAPCNVVEVTYQTAGETAGAGRSCRLGAWSVANALVSHQSPPSIPPRSRSRAISVSAGSWPP